jgi:hypothetical protein
MKGIPPEPGQFNYEGFLEYSTQWCERCKIIFPTDLLTFVLAALFPKFTQEKQGNEKDRRNNNPGQLH